MSITNITTQSDWHDNDEFLQSWNYGEFLIKNGRHVLRLQIDGAGETSYIQMTEMHEKPGISYYYLPRAVVKNTKHLQELLDYAKKNGKTFIRLESAQHLSLPPNYHAIQTPNRQPPDSWLQDITLSKETILAGMHSKTRYNINLAQKRGVVIDEEKNIDLFWPIHLVTCERNNYVPHPKSYIEKLLNLENVYQINARFEHTLLASAIVLHHAHTMYYYFGASSNDMRNLMGPYLMHSYIIDKAKELGCTTYDWWGMAPPAEKGSSNAECYHEYCWQKDHVFAGVARFKAGFGGHVVSYPHAVEIPLHSFYYALYQLKNKLRKPTIVGHPR